jgi:hypothetical protein
MAYAIRNTISAILIYVSPFLVIAYISRGLGAHVLIIGHFCLSEKVVALIFIENLRISWS